MVVTIAIEKKHFLMMGLIISIPFMLFFVSNIIAVAPSGQYHSSNELYVENNIDMNGNNLTNIKKITVDVIETNTIESNTITITNICLDGVCKSSWSEIAESVFWGNNNLEIIENDYCIATHGSAPSGWTYYDRNKDDGRCYIQKSSNSACPTNYGNKMTKTQKVSACYRWNRYYSYCKYSCTTAEHKVWSTDPVEWCGRPPGGSCVYISKWVDCRTIYATVSDTRCLHN